MTTYNPNDAICNDLDDVDIEEEDDLLEDYNFDYACYALQYENNEE